MYTDIQRWYGGKIPPHNTPEFRTFLASSMSFVRYISHDFLNPIHIKMDINAPTAKTTQNNDFSREMILPAWPLYPDAWPEIIPHAKAIAREDYSVATVGLFTGFVIHESQHMGVSPASPAKAFEQAGQTDYLDGVKHPKSLINIYQCVEDLYVDDLSYSRPYGIFTDVLNRTLLPLELCDEIMTAVIAETTVLNGVNLCMAYKNPDFRTHAGLQLFPEITVLLEEALTANSSVDRVNIACDIYKKLLETDNESSPQEDSEDAEPTHWDGDCEVCSVESDDLDDELSLTLAQKEALETLEQELMMHTGEDIFNIEHILPVQTWDVMRAPDYCFENKTGAITPAEAWVTFGRQLRLIRSKNYTPGPATIHGHRIVNTRLTRIVTDDKIFGDPQENKQKDQREVRLLIDLSGSMNHILEDVLEAGMGIFMGLRDSLIPCTVYGHTTTRGKNDRSAHRPALFQIAQPMSTNLTERFSRAYSLNNLENIDGLIIEAVGKTFLASPTQKVLIVLSDGEPASPNYRGKPAVEHTKKVVDRLRQRGVLVYAVSLVEGVYRSNDYIYGKRWNIRGGDALLTTEIKKLILKISDVT